MVSKTKPELLCPVGGKPQLIAAVENGADAIYLGGSEFNARIYADNFTDIAFLEEAVDYAHLKNVKVYVTLNTLVNDEEIGRAVDYAKKLYQIGVDAVIVQDLGLISRISEEIPNLPIHVSTQATVYSTQAIEFLKKYKSISRVVLARELSLSEIEKIVQNVDKEIEVFVHGALCVCYSGQCKLSSQIGARSGNRGKCAQPCRLPYRLIEENSGKVSKEDYYLSTKDICTIDILPQIISSGVHSLKIEGRMKSPEYVAAVTRIYRKYIDKCFEKESYKVEEVDKNELLQVFNRGYFSTGYLLSKESKRLWCNIRPKHWGTYLGEVIDYNKNKNNIKLKLENDIMIGDGVEVINQELSGGIVSYIREGKDRVKEAKKGSIVTIGDIKGNIRPGQKIYKISSKKLNENLKQLYIKNNIKKIDVNAKIHMRAGENIKVKFIAKILDKEFEVETNSKDICEIGIKKVLNKDMVINQFSKTGDVPFSLKNIDIDIEDGIMTSVSNINEVRRRSLEMLSKKIIRAFKHDQIDNKKSYELNKNSSIKDKNVKTKLALYIYSVDMLDTLDCLDNVDRVYISLKDIVKYKDLIKDKISKEKIFVYIENITTEKYKEYILKNIEAIKDIGNILVTNIEHLEVFKKYNLNLCLDNSFNMFNSNSIEEMNLKNIDTVCISNELSLDKINDLKISNNVNSEIDIYGNLPVMFSNFCPISASITEKSKCGICLKGKYLLRDRKENDFPMLFNNIDCTVKILNCHKLFSKEAILNLNGKVNYMRIYIYDESKKNIKNVIEGIKDIIQNSEKSTFDLTSDNKTKYTNGNFFKEV